MPTCRICLNTFKSLKFLTEHISICTRCVNTLNNTPEPAQNAEARFAEKLARGMHRNAENDLHADEPWKRRKAEKILADLDTAVDAALHNWITGLLEKPENSSRDFKIIRAQRRGLLRAEGFADYGSQTNWENVARRIRQRDGYKCTSCGAIEITLDVHHIVYLSHHGTNQQSNLITLCRKCHETEHKRTFDWPEAQDPESSDPIQPSPDAQKPALSKPPPVMPSTDSAPTIVVDIVAKPQPKTELCCPTCLTELTIPSKLATVGKRIRCPKCTVIFDFTMKNIEPPITKNVTNQAVIQCSSTPVEVSLDFTQKPNVMLRPKPRCTTNKLVDMVLALAIIFLVYFVLR